MPVRIVTDSSSGLPQEVAEELGITVLDLHVLNREAKDGKEEATTSGLSSLELAAGYARQLERGGDEGVVALHLSGQLSSTYSAAVSAAGIFDDQVRIVETDSVGMAVGAAAMAAASLALDGASLDECQAKAEETLRNSATWLYLQRIDEMRKSGRLSAGTAFMSAALLAIKPIMQLTGGKMELAGKTRTQTKAFAKLVELVLERAQGEPAFVAIQHNDAQEGAYQLRDLLEEMLADGSSFMVLPLTPALAIHTGPGAIGVSAVYTASQEPDSDSEEQDDGDSASPAAE